MAKIYSNPPNKSSSTHVKPDNSAEADKFLAHKFNITKFLFDKQLAFVQDPAEFKVAVCSRRGGKTVACAADLTDTAIKNAGVICLYITLSANNAKKLVWKELTKINRDFKLNGRVDNSELSITFPNGSIIYCSGAKDASEIEKFRGLAIKLCYIDECQSFREYLKDLIDDIISPALMDYAGTLCLIGTPGPIPTGYFYECSEQSKVWSKHYWTFFDNPHISTKSKKTHQQILDRELKRRGVLVSDPSIQREYFGKWVLDSDSLLIKYSAGKNHYESVPPFKTKPTYVMGIDVGFRDADAICILAWYDDSPITYLIEEVIETKQGLTELVDQVNALRAKYEISKIVMDMGGLGKKLGEEMIRRYLIPVEAADKVRKMENIALLNDALRSGRLMAKSNSRFAQDTYLVEIDRDKSRPDKIAVSSRYHSDIIDAVLYAFKLSPAYAWTPAPKKPKYGTPEWAAEQHDKMFEAELEGLQKEQSFERWLKGESN